ncbi:hypothetical protein AFL94_08870 [Arthrobacter sp. LS16]|nr:hypothetical protein AFL94_08870 [Arthrobacter sp. LS16]
MPDQPPLNPDAVRAALAWFAQAVAEVEVKFAADGTRPGDYWTGYRAAKNEIADLLAEPKLIAKAVKVGIAATQPEVTSVEELDALPAGSVVSSGGREFYKTSYIEHPWILPYGVDRFGSGYLAKQAKVTILHRPEVGDA